MRIVVSCLQSLKPHQIPAYRFWRTSFVQGLEEAGHDVIEVPGVDWAEGLVYECGQALDAWRARTWETVCKFTLQELKNRPIHLFLFYLYPKQVECAAIREVQRLGVPCVNFFCDNVREFRQVPSEYRDFALHWVPEFEGLDMYRAAGLKFINAPMPCWVPPDLRHVDSIESEPATFIGSADPLRRQLLGEALELGADFIVRGRGWEDESDRLEEPAAERRPLLRILATQVTSIRSHGFRAMAHKVYNCVRPLRYAPLPLSRVGKAPDDDAEYMRVTRESIVTIGINRVPSAYTSYQRPRAYSRLRDIEAPMLGACYLTEWTAGLQQMYELGSEIETYRTAEELTNKLAELRKNAARRRTMRQRARIRALEEHSVKRTIARICSQLGLQTQ